jgi:hypothetical protein
MKKTCPTAIVLGLVATGCVSYASLPRPSMRMVGVANASAESRVDATTTANQLARVFGERGFVLHAQHVDSPGGAIALELRNDHPRGGGIFYAWVEPEGASGSLIWMAGGPVTWIFREFADYTAQAAPWGAIAADVEQSVTSELELAGVVSGAVPPSAVPPAGMAAVQARAHQDCEEIRREIAQKAGSQNDVDKRAEILHTAPSCR